MDLLSLPDDVFIHMIKNYIGMEDLLQLHITCKRFHALINKFNLFFKYLKLNPIIDFNYPYGYDEYGCYSVFHKKYRNALYKLKLANRWKNGVFTKKIIYNYNMKMLPQLQLDESDSSLYFTHANTLINMTYDPYDYSFVNKPTQSFNINPIGIDIHNFIKKDDYLVCSSSKDIICNLVTQTSYPSAPEGSDACAFDMHKMKQLRFLKTIHEHHSIVKCFDFTVQSNKLVYGCSNGLIKMHNLNDEDDNSQNIKEANLNDRLIRTVFSPSNQTLAIGTAGVIPHSNFQSCPLRIYNVERFEQMQILMPKEKLFMRGAGILALSFIDENTVLAAGYDTFIRVFDLRTSKEVQTFEEPEDSTIYCVCCSKEYGMLSGNDRFSLIRYWDRRQGNIINSFQSIKCQ